MEFFFFLKKIVVAASFTADGNLLQPTGVCASLFSRARVMMSHTTLAQVFVRVIPSMFHLLTLTSTFSSSMWMLPEQDPLCISPNEESHLLANNDLSHTETCFQNPQSCSGLVI